MTRQPSTALIIVNWNSGSCLDRCLAAVEAQHVRPWQTIVVDNHSDDGSADGLEQRYPFVRVVRLNENSGFAAANNLAVREAGDCDWIALLNPDAFPEPGWLESLLGAADRHPEYTFFGSRMLNDSDTASLDGTGDVYHVSGLAWRRGHGAAAVQRDLAEEEIFSPCAAAALYRRDAFLEAGGFDESYFTYFEDVDLGFRLRLAGHRCLYVPAAVVRHVGSATLGQHSDFAIYHGHRNTVWTFFKNMPMPLFWFYLPQHIIMNLAALFWYSLQGRAGVMLAAKWDALKGLPRMLAKRHGIQASRRVNAWALRRQMATGIRSALYRTRHPGN